MADRQAPQVPAVVLAGAPADEALRAAAGVEVRAMAPVLGRPVVGYCLDALGKAAGVGPVFVVGPEALRPALAGEALVPSGGSLLENVRRGMDAAGTQGPVLLASADLPYLTAAAVESFLAAALDSGADLCYSVARFETIEAEFPGMRRTYASLADGRFTGGNLFLIRGGFFYRCEPLLNAAYAARKRPFQLARMLGIGTLVALLTHRLTIAAAEARLSRILGGQARAIVTAYPETAADADRPEELAEAEAYLLAKGRGAQGRGPEHGGQGA